MQTCFFTEFPCITYFIFPHTDCIVYSNNVQFTQEGFMQIFSKISKYNPDEYFVVKDFFSVGRSFEFYRIKLCKISGMVLDKNNQIMIYLLPIMT